MSMFRKQGGVDGVISNTGFDIKEWPGKNGKESYSTLSFGFDFTVDGATEPSRRFIPAGFVYEGTTVSEDGKTLLNDSDGGIIAENTEFARFIGSLVEKGFSESALDPSGRNFEAIEGTRVQLTQWVDEEATKKFGKRVAKSGPNKGKEYNRTETRIGQVYGKAEVAKTAAKPAAKGQTKGGAKAAAPKAERNTEVLDAAIQTIVADQPVPRSSVSSQVVKYALANKLDSATRDMLRKELSDEAYLTDAASRGVISYDASDKKQMISLPEAA